jgi:hypothetical protein
MDLSLVSAGAGLVGATVGGAMSLLGSWIGHQREVRAQWLGQDRLRRQKLYKEFIQEASKCYAHALEHEKPDVPLLVVLYGKISRMRVILPRYLLLPSKCSGALWTSILNRPSCSVPLRFVRCSKTDRSTFLGTSASVVEPNSTCSASNKFEMILNGVLELKLSTHPDLPRPGRISVTVG